MENSILLYWQTFKRAQKSRSLVKKGSGVHDAVSCTLTVPSARTCFYILYGISYSRFRRLKEHHEEHGVAQRVHGNCKKLPHNALPRALSPDVRNFLTNYVEESAVLLPGRIPGFKKDDICLLLSSETKMNILKEHAKKQENRLFVLQHLQSYGSSFTLMLLSPSQ